MDSFIETPQRFLEIVAMKNSNSVSRKDKLIKRVLIRESLFGPISSSKGDWDLVRAYAYGGSTLLSEGSRSRAKLLAEGFLSSFASAFQFVGEKISDGWEMIKDMSAELRETASKVLIAIMDEIPKGKQFFAIIQNFSKGALEAAGEAIRDKIEEIGASLISIKEEIFEKLFSKEIFTDDLLNKVKESAKSASKEIKDWLNSIGENPAQAVKQLFLNRELFGEFASKMVKFILEESKEASRILRLQVGKLKAINDPKTGKLALGIFRLATSNLSNLDEIVETAEMIWSGAQNLNKQINSMASRVEINPREFVRSATRFLPNALGSLISGNNPVEVLVRSISGDPTKIIKLSLKLGVQAIQKLSGKLIEPALKIAGLTEGSKSWKIVKKAIESLVGVAAGAVGKAVSESKNFRFQPNKRLTLTENQLRKLVRNLLENGNQSVNREASAPTPIHPKIDSLIKDLEKINKIISSYSTKEGAKVTIGLGARKSGKYTNIYFAFNYEFPEGDSSYSFSGRIYDVHHVIMNELEMPKEIKEELASKIPYGFIQISKESPTEDREYEKCKGPNGKTPYYIHLTNPTKKGWGPLLYDAAIDYASMDGSGLMSDRTTVSPEARGVWEKYAMRPDVTGYQMDTHALSNDSGLKQRTPNESSDDCSQYVAITSKDRLDWNRLRIASDEYLDSSELERKRELERIWEKSPLSKIYFTSGETINTLKTKKMFWMHD